MPNNLEIFGQKTVAELIADQEIIELDLEGDLAINSDIYYWPDQGLVLKRRKERDRDIFDPYKATRPDLKTVFKITQRLRAYEMFEQVVGILEEEGGQYLVSKYIRIAKAIDPLKLIQEPTFLKDINTACLVLDTNGVLHNDLTSSNVKVKIPRELIILDFDEARIINWAEGNIHLPWITHGFDIDQSTSRINVFNIDNFLFNYFLPTIIDNNLISTGIVSSKAINLFREFLNNQLEYCAKLGQYFQQINQSEYQRAVNIRQANIQSLLDNETNLRQYKSQQHSRRCNRCLDACES